jgi:hypothetical protein
MIGVDVIGQIRRAYFEQRRPIKEIVRTFSVSRATVRKVVRSQATKFKYERTVQPSPELGEWVAILGAILEKESKLPRRERRSTQRLFEELRARGYEGAHDSVHRFVKSWRAERARVPAQAYVPMSFATGEAYQFDWSHETITSVRAAGALRNGAPFKNWDLPPALAQVRSLLKSHIDGDRQFVKVLATVPDQGLAAVEAACAEAVAAGIASGDVILTILARQREPATPPSIITPDALRLKHEPVADCGRYDNIRNVA